VLSSLFERIRTHSDALQNQTNTPSSGLFQEQNKTFFRNYHSFRWALVAYACNPSYSGGSRLETSLWGKKFKGTYLEKTHHKTELVSQGVGPEFKPQYCQKTIIFLMFLKKQLIYICSFKNGVN
jgi:hypothetical protein